MRALAKNLALLTGSVAISLGVAELAVRLAAPQQLIVARPDIWQPVDTLGWSHRPHVRTKINTGEGVVDFMTDAKGFRVGQNGGVVAPTRVLLLGDSFGAALQVQYEESLPGLLERRLPTVLGRRVAVHNTAVNGHSPSQYLIRARQELAREPYGLVLVMFFLGNDILEDRAEYYPPLQQTNVRNFRVPRHATWTEIVDAMLYPINDFLKQHSHLFVLAKNQARTVLMRMGLTYLHIPYEVLRANAADRRWTTAAELMRDIDAEGRARATPVLFLLIPGHYQVEPEVFRQYVTGFDIDPASVDLEQPNRLLSEAFAPYSLNTLDLLAPLRAEAKKGRKLYGDVDVHLSPDGHDVIERLIEPTIVKLLNRGACTPGPIKPSARCENP